MCPIRNGLRWGNSSVTLIANFLLFHLYWDIVSLRRQCFKGTIAVWEKIKSENSRVSYLVEHEFVYQTTSTNREEDWSPEASITEKATWAFNGTVLFLENQFGSLWIALMSYLCHGHEGVINELFLYLLAPQCIVHYQTIYRYCWDVD